MRTATFTVLASAALAAAQPGFVVVQRDGACAVGSTVPYIVQSGDTLTKIATALGSGICDIAKASGLASPDFILNGASLTVPIKLASPDNKSCVKQAPPATAVCVVGGDKTYTIKSGDTLYLVSVALGITLDSLLAANKGVVPENLNAGDKINVPIC
ncbi:endochitinase 1 precursor [Apiospora kogelbergensis]|uniref:Endochitinase 1 n=1 Tax=Apiospora kogelbergensis TaxID=1337665 RepID=A0AAW0QVE4_9PEZI